MTKAKRKPHLLSVSDQLLKRLAERGELSAQTAGEFARQLLTCFLDGLPLPPRVPGVLLEQAHDARPPAPTPPEKAPIPEHRPPPAAPFPAAVPPARAAAPAAVRQYPPPVLPAAEQPPRPLFQPAPVAPPPVVATGPNPDIDFNNPDDEALRRATELLDSSARRQS